MYYFPWFLPTSIAKILLKKSFVFAFFDNAYIPSFRIFSFQLSRSIPSFRFSVRTMLRSIRRFRIFLPMLLY
jgi:hypothetical protein